MDDVTHTTHDDMCCDETRPHVHGGEEDGRWHFRLARGEWSGPTLEEWLDTVGAWLSRFDDTR